MRKIMEKEEAELMEEPAVKMYLRVTAGDGKPLTQHWWVNRGVCIPLYYGVNLIGNRPGPEDELLGFFYESGGEVWFLPMLEESDPVCMQVGTELSFYDIHIQMFFVRRSSGYGGPKPVRRSGLI